MGRGKEEQVSHTLKDREGRGEEEETYRLRKKWVGASRNGALIDRAPPRGVRAGGDQVLHSITISIHPRAFH